MVHQPQRCGSPAQQSVGAKKVTPRYILTLHIYTPCCRTMFLRLAVLCAVLGGVLSALQLSSEETGYKVSDKVQRNFYSYVDKRESGSLYSCHNIIHQTYSIIFSFLNQSLSLTSSCLWGCPLLLACRQPVIPPPGFSNSPFTVIPTAPPTPLARL